MIERTDAYIRNGILRETWWANTRQELEYEFALVKDWYSPTVYGTSLYDFCEVDGRVRAKFYRYTSCD